MQMANLLLLEEPFLLLGGATSVLHQLYGSVGSQVGAPRKDTLGLLRRSPHTAALATSRALFPALCPTLGLLFLLAAIEAGHLALEFIFVLFLL